MLLGSRVAGVAQNRALLLDLNWGLWPSIAITLCSDAEQECGNHKADNAFFLRGEDKSMPQLGPRPPMPGFHRFVRGRIFTEE